MFFVCQDKKKVSTKDYSKKRTIKSSFSEYTIPDSIMRRLKLFGITDNFDHVVDMNNWLKEIDHTLRMNLELVHIPATQKEMIEYTKEFKEDFYIHYISILAYQVDEYCKQEEHARMLIEMYDMFDGFKKKMRNFI